MKEYKTNEVSEKLQVSNRTIQRWVRTGKLKPSKIIQGCYFFSETEVLKHVQTNSDDNESTYPQESTNYTSQIHDINLKIRELNRKLNLKADDIVFTQLLYQRKEISELQEYIKVLENKVSKLESYIYNKI